MAWNQIGADRIPFKAFDRDRIPLLRFDPVRCPSIPSPMSTGSMGLAWAWRLFLKNRFKENRKKYLCRRWDLNPHALAGNGF